MGRRILAAALLVVFISLAIMGFIFTRTSEKYLIEQLEENLISDAWLIQRLVAREMETPTSPTSIEEFEALAASLSQEIAVRVTIIDGNGRVLGDSDINALELESHLERPEIRDAFRGGVGKSVRYSTSLHRKMLYLAVPIMRQGSVSGVVRLALPLEQVNQFSWTLWKGMLAAGLTGLLVALVTSYYVAHALAKPLREAAMAAKEIAQGQYNRRMRVGRGPVEIRALASAFNEMAGNLEEVISELTERKNRIEAVLSSMDDSLIAIDYKRQVIMLNPKAEALFQTSEEQALNRHLLEVARNQGLYNVINDVLEKKRVIHQELCLYTPEEKNFRIHTAPIRGGERWGAVAVIRDITELKKTEQMRREFVANVSHELKTPLTSIAGYVETLLDGAYQDPEVNLRFLGIIHRETERLKRLIEDLLQLSRVESSKGQINRVPVDLKEAILRVLSLLKPSIEEREQKIALEFANDLPLVLASEDNLEQIVLNLADNASKYSPEGSLITIAAQAEGENVSFWVADQGPGIPAEALPRIFERFYRLDKARTREISGTGLGLALVKHLVDGLEGTIEVTSEPGLGTQFKVILPKV